MKFIGVEKRKKQQNHIGKNQDREKLLEKNVVDVFKRNQTAARSLNQTQGPMPKRKHSKQ